MRPCVSKKLAALVLLLAFPCVPISAQEKTNEAVELYNRALRLIGQEKQDEAAQSLKTLIAKSPDFERAYAKLVHVHKKKKTLTKAVDYFEALIKEHPKNGYAHYGLGLIYSAKHQYAKALEEYKSSLEIGGACPGCYANLVDAYRASKQLDEAIVYLEARLKINPERADVHYGLGYAYRFKAQMEKGLRHLGEALEIKPALIEAYKTKGDTYYDSSRFSEALNEYEKMAGTAEKAADLENKGISFRALGNVHWKLGDYLQAQAYCRKGLEISQQIGDREEEGKILNTLGVIYRDLGSYPQALAYFLRSLKIKQQTGHRAGQGGTLDNIGNTYRELGNDPQALQYYWRSLHIRRQEGDKLGEARVLNNLGDYYKDRSKHQLALKYHQRSLTIFQETRNRQEEGLTRIGLGMIYTALGDTETALQNHRRALEIANEINNPEIRWRSHDGLARALEIQEKFSEALEHYESAIRTIEDVRGQLQLEQEKFEFFKDKIAVYKNLISLLSNWHAKENAKGYDRLAYYYLEKARARALVDLLAEVKINSTRGLAPDLLEKKRRNLERLKKLAGEEHKDQMNELDEEYQEIIREIKKQSPDYAALVYPQTIDLSQAQELLDADTVLLEYSIGEKESWLFAVTRAGLKILPLPNQRALDRMIIGEKNGASYAEGFIEALTLDPNDESKLIFVAKAYRLYKTLLKPAEALVKAKKRLIIVPDGCLAYLPFQVLLDREVSGRGQIDFSQLPYLVKKYSISYAPSTTVLKNLLERKEEAPGPRKSFLAFADPIYPHEKGTRKNNGREQSSNLVLGSTNINRLERLSNSGVEVEKISKLFPRYAVQIYEREKATAANLKSEDLTQYEYVHFATHAISNVERPHLSSLILTLDERAPTNGILPLREIYDLRLAAKLVVLSACQTGFGRLVTGEGLIGLTRGFMYAGSRSVLASLWAIYDDATADLMYAFYKHLRSEGNAEALRRAQLEMIKRGHPYSHPYYWGAFVLVGER